MRNEDETKALLNTGKWAYTMIDNEIHFKYLGNKDKTDLGYILHFDWPEQEEQPMSEITKLYENANIEKEVIKGCYEYYSELGIDIWKENDCRGKNCNTCKADKSIKEYPPFTAEKQLELLKICLDKYEKLEKVRGLKERCIIYYRFDTNGYTEFVNCETWEETIAGLINNLWQDLSPEEKRQVKGILE